MRQTNGKILRRILLISFTLNLFAVIYSQRIQILYDTSYTRQLGGSFPLGIIHVDNKGKTRMTRGFLSGNQFWAYYYVNVMGGTFSNGKVHIAASPETISDHKISVSAHLMSDLKIFTSIDIPLTYKGLTVADYTPHEDFKYGQPGDMLDVYVSKYYDNIYKGELIRVKIASMNKNNVLVYYIHPTEGQIHIIANGGYGEDGKSVAYSENGGDGGNGGTVNVYILENARNFADRIKISNYGGYGGRGYKSENATGTNGINGLNGPAPGIRIVSEF